jgi:hypothetical protein
MSDMLLMSYMLQLVGRAYLVFNQQLLNFVN